VDFRLVVFWLVRLRWSSIVGQAIIIAVSAWFLKFDWTLTSKLLLLTSVAVVSNITLSFLVRRELDLLTLRSVIASTLLFDIFLLTIILYLTGGASNPFSILYLVYIVLAAVLLDKRWTWITASLSAICFALLFIELLLAPAGAMHHHHDQGAMSLHLQGMLFTFIVAAFLISYFLTRIINSQRDAERALQTVELLRLKQQRLASITTLAAGAAHELGTPLASISLAASELESQLQSSPSEQSKLLLEDVHLIRSEVLRCKEILTSMSGKAGNILGEMPEPINLNVFIDLLKSELKTESVRPVEFKIDSNLQTSSEQFYLPLRTVKQSLVALINNAIEASVDGQKVQVTFSKDSNRIIFKIKDQGIGMSKELLSQVGQPFFSTKSPHQGMGLGVFLTKLVAEQLGGELAYESELGIGTTTSLILPISTSQQLFTGARKNG
jgi:two-component system sensor histidine kinase RegB